MILEEKNKLLAALSQIPQAKTVSSAWPSSVSALPCITLSLASSTPDRPFDDQPYAHCIQWYVRCFGKPNAAHQLAQAAHPILQSLGYLRTFCAEEATPNSAQVWMRYQTIKE